MKLFNYLGQIIDLFYRKMKLFGSTVGCCADANSIFLFFLFASVVHVTFLQGNQFADLARGKITEQQNEKEA